jgi:organic hydroperoxide reductase OsmC/OhrA
LSVSSITTARTTTHGQVLYTAEAVGQGGRAGGPGTNPAQLFADGYAACFASALLGVARGNIDVRLTVDGAPLRVKVADTSSAN